MHNVISLKNKLIYKKMMNKKENNNIVENKKTKELSYIIWPVNIKKLIHNKILNKSGTIY